MINLVSDYNGFDPIFGGWWVLAVLGFGVLMLVLSFIWDKLSAYDASETAIAFAIGSGVAAVILYMVWGITGWGSDYTILQTDIKAQSGITMYIDSYSEREFLGADEDGIAVRCVILDTETDNHYEMLCGEWSGTP